MFALPKNVCLVSIIYRAVNDKFRSSSTLEFKPNIPLGFKADRLHCICKRRHSAASVDCIMS
jgi:hypothetical protein